MTFLIYFYSDNLYIYIYTYIYIIYIYIYIYIYLYIYICINTRHPLQILVPGEHLVFCLCFFWWCNVYIYLRKKEKKKKEKEKKNPHWKRCERRYGESKWEAFHVYFQDSAEKYFRFYRNCEWVEVEASSSVSFCKI